MTRVIADISMSLDGFVTGPRPDVEHGLGLDADALHTWALQSEDPVDLDVLRESTEATGAVVMGRRLFDIVDGPDGWDEAMGYGAHHAASPRFFVVTHVAPEATRLDLEFEFVTDGIDAAVEQARAAAAAAGKDVFVMGGADVVRQCVHNGLVDELRIHLAAVVLGSGTPLFDGRRCELTQRSVRVSTTATHLTYAIA
jgi:dihydrofolate reductase